MRKQAKDVVLGMLTSKEMIEELELMKESGVVRRQISGRISASISQRSSGALNQGYGKLGTY